MNETKWQVWDGDEDREIVTLPKFPTVGDVLDVLGLGADYTVTAIDPSTVTVSDGPDVFFRLTRVV